MQGGAMTDASWPAPPAEAVFHGPAGEFVLRTDPHTESHPMALLSQFLVAFGTADRRRRPLRRRGLAPPQQ